MNDMAFRSLPASGEKIAGWGDTGSLSSRIEEMDATGRNFQADSDVLPREQRFPTVRIAALMVLAVLVGACLVLGAQRIGAGKEAVLSAPLPEALPTPPVGVGALGRVVPATRIRRLGPPSTIAVTRVGRLFVQQGEQVKAGQLLAEFADANLKDAAVAEAAAKVVEAQAELALVKAGGRPSQIAAQEAHIASLKAQQEIAQRDAARSAALVPSGAATRAAADQDYFAAARASANLLQAENDMVTLQQPRPEDVALAEARLQAAETALASARADAALSRVYAPVAGTILQIYARPGDAVGAAGLLDIADLNQLDVLADVYQTDLPRVKMGAPAEVIVPGEAHSYEARVVRIGSLVQRTLEAGTDPVARVDGRTVEVWLALAPAASAALRHRIDMQVQVAIRP